MTILHRLQHPCDHHRGATLSEMSFMVGMIAILMLVGSYKILQLRADAERVAFLQTVTALKQALAIEVARTAGREGTPALARLDRINPMTLLGQPPATYLGELAQPDLTAIAGYQWYFDTEQRLLIYRVEHDQHFRSSLSGPARIRLQLRLEYTDRDSDGRFHADVDLAHNLALQAVDTYQWEGTDEH